LASDKGLIRTKCDPCHGIIGINPETDPATNDYQPTRNVHLQPIRSGLARKTTKPSQTKRGQHTSCVAYEMKIRTGKKNNTFR